MIVEVVGPPLRHLGRLVRAGARVDLAEPMARAFVSQGRARVVEEQPTAAAAPAQAMPDAQRNHQHQKRR